MDILFDKWRAHLKEQNINEKFVEDGIIDKEKYRNIVWFLRETNDYSGKLHQLIRECIQNPKEHKKYWKTPNTHYKQSLAIAGLIHPDLSYLDLKKMRKEALLYSAVVNIKKTSGKSRANIDQILNFLKNDKKFIKEEILQLKPKVVIVGGMKSVKRIRSEIIELFNLEKIDTDLFVSKENNIYFIATYHPSYPAIKHQEWSEMFQNIARKNKIDLA